MGLFICRSYSRLSLVVEARLFFVTLLKQSFPNRIMTLYSLPIRKPSSPLIKYRFVIIASRDSHLVLMDFSYLSFIRSLKGVKKWSFRLIPRFFCRFPPIHWLIFPNFSFSPLWLFLASWKEIKNELLWPCDKKLASKSPTSFRWIKKEYFIEKKINFIDFKQTREIMLFDAIKT